MTHAHEQNSGLNSCFSSLAIGQHWLTAHYTDMPPINPRCIVLSCLSRGLRIGRTIFTRTMGFFQVRQQVTATSLYIQRGCRQFWKEHGFIRPTSTVPRPATHLGPSEDTTGLGLLTVIRQGLQWPTKGSWALIRWGAREARSSRGLWGSLHLPPRYTPPRSRTALTPDGALLVFVELTLDEAQHQTGLPHRGLAQQH